MALIRFAFCIALGLVPSIAAAVSLQMPTTARQTAERISPFGSYGLPKASYDGHAVPVEVFEGRVGRRTWRIDGGSFTTLQVMAPLRDQLAAAGFDPVFECEAETCGGFDFRFGVEVVPAPDMHVDIQDFRFLSALHEDGRAVSLLVSRSRTALFVQAIDVVPASQPSAPAYAPENPTGSQPTDLSQSLRQDGHVILSDLAFATGGSALRDSNYTSLRDIAGFLDQNPDLNITLVGHTDSVGDLSNNIRLSKQRAEAVRARLISAHNVDPTRIAAEGNGYLAPIASNLTPEGRDSNRRVEAIVLPRR